MWLDEQCTAILEHPGPTVFVAPLAFGASHIVAGLSRERDLVWVELAEADSSDDVAQGNKLVDAVKRALGSPVLPAGLPFQYGLHFLKSNLPLLGPFTFAITGAEHGPAFARSLLELDDGDNRVVLSFTSGVPDLEFPYNTRLLAEEQLCLHQEQALELAAGRLEENRVLELWRRADGAYTNFLVALNEALSLPLPLRPSPVGPHLPPGREIQVAPEQLLEVLIAKERWVEALEVAARYLPERAPEVLGEGGHAYHERGLHQRLFELLGKLPPEVAACEPVLRWRLVAAAWLGKVRTALPAVERYLANHEAPELRATYAPTRGTPAAQEAEARRAYQVKQTPLTTFQYGRLHHQPERGAELLHRAVELAETRGHPYEVARNAATLGAHLIHLGRYQEAAHWSGWALEFFDRHELADGQRRLRILNDWAYSRLLVGNTMGLEHPLVEAEPHLGLASPELARVFRSTLGDYYLATDAPARAIPYYRKNWESAPRVALGRAAIGMTRALLGVSEVQDALEIAKRAYVLTKHEASHYHLPAALALGMALAFLDPQRALPLLEPLLEPTQSHFVSALHIAQASLHLAYAKLQLGETQGTREILARAGWATRELSLTGLRLLSGPDTAFQRVWRLAQGERPPLELKLLGEFEVWLEGRHLDVPPQWGEILAILALDHRPEGLSREQLHLRLMGDRGSPGSLKTALSKMRQRLPISRHPYRITLPFSTDVHELLHLLEAQQISDALSKYRGPILPRSDAPCIRSHREIVENQLRESVIQSGDAESMASLAEMLGDDLELWHLSGQALNDRDPRTPIVRARIRQVLTEWER